MVSPTPSLGLSRSPASSFSRPFTRGEPEFAIASSAAEVRKLVARGRIALVPAFEGAEAIESVDDVDVLFAAGARVIGLVHFVDNALANAEDGQFGPLASLFDGAAGGLTPLGQKVIRRMEQLGMAIDLSHASERTIADVLATTGAPVLYSHAGSAFRRPPTLPDELARRIGQRGGVIGIGVYRSAPLQPLPPPSPGALRAVSVPTAFGTPAICHTCSAVLWRAAFREQRWTALATAFYG